MAPSGTENCVGTPARMNAIEVIVMTDVFEDTKGQIRDLPIADRLRTLLRDAGAASGIDRIRVVSGGQCALGTCTKRTGSVRHDLGNAADLELGVGGRVLTFTVTDELPFFIRFVTEAARRGATGIGAGEGYMNDHTIHVGFGKRAVWGKSGTSANAPAWLRAAAEAGWAHALGSAPLAFKVVARQGLHLRAGPAATFNTLSQLQPGTVVTVQGFDGATGDWARIDLQGDGLVDGHLHRAFLVPLDAADETPVGDADDCSADVSTSG